MCERTRFTFGIILHSKSPRINELLPAKQWYDGRDEADDDEWDDAFFTPAHIAPK